MKPFGTRYEVFCGEALRTRYGLTKDGLVMSHGKVVSKVKHDHAMANKQAYVEKMNVRRRSSRAPSGPPPARPSSSATSDAIVVPATRSRAQPDQSPAAQLKRLRDLASRTY